MKVVLIDDEPLALTVLKEYLADHPEFEVKAEAPNGFEGMKAIQQHQPDLIFLDVQMPKISGFEMLELLDDVPPVIFTTAFEQYALKAFEANAVDYLLKPFSKERFDQAMDRFRTQQLRPAVEVRELTRNQVMSRIVLRDQGQIRILPLKDVSYLEADVDYVRIHADKAYMKKETLTYFEERLPEDQFIRTHRSYLVNLAYVSRIEPYEKTSHIAVLKNGSKVPVSKSGYQRLKEVLDL